MNYQKLYKTLCSGNSTDEYTENHHIVPKCMNGSDNASNFVKLSAKGHYLAHRLLVKIYPDNIKLKFAYNMMSRGNASQKRTFSPKQYELMKKANSIALSALHKGKQYTLGRKAPIEERMAMSARRKGVKLSPAHAAKVALANKGRKVSDKTRLLMSNLAKGRIGTRKGVILSKETRTKISDKHKKKNAPSFNTCGYRILTPSGWQSFSGVSYSGLVECLTFKTSHHSITVSKKHRFHNERLARDYAPGDLIETDSGPQKILSISPAGKRRVYDVLDVGGGNLYYANNIVNHNCELVLDDDLALIKDWKDEYACEIPKDQYYPYYHRYVGMDLGRKDHTALIYGYYDFKRATLMIEDEMTMNGPDWTTITLKDGILAKEKELWGEIKPFRRISDNNNPHLIQDLNSLHDVHFIETNKESLEAMINEVRIMVSQGQIIIDPKCKMTIGCLKYGVWDKNRKAFARNSHYGHYDHLAALIYLVRNLAKSSNPLPAVLNPTHKTWYGAGPSRLTPSGQAMAKALNIKKNNRS